MRQQPLSHGCAVPLRYSLHRGVFWSGALRKAAEKKEFPRRVAEEEKVESLFAVGGGIGGQHPLFGIGDKIEQGGGEQG